MFGKISPKDQDIYQKIALDSLNNNQITMLRGKAGSGKSILSFAYMFSQLEKGNIDKIIIFCNTVAAKGAAKLGYYPGDRVEKLLDSQIGNLLESKLGSRSMVEKLIAEESLVLLPIADIRGYDTSGMNAAVYISEAQNLDVELMRLALQRIGEDSICIIDGDFSHQVDMEQYAGSSNGMRRVSEVFRGQDFYGEVELQNIHRSKIANIAELM
jgi:predicted ribonuclease YlaK